MKKHVLLIAAITVSFTNLCYAKTKTFTWQNDLCEFEGQYNPQQYSEKQLQDTVQMMQLSHTSLLNSRSYAFKPEDIAKIKLKEIDQEYKNTRTQLNNLHPIPLKVFQTLKQNLLTALDQEYRHNYLTAAAFSQPEKLLISDYGQQCFAIAKSLNTRNSNTLLKNAKNSLEKENKHQLKLGNNQDFLAKRAQDFDAKLKSKNAVQYAQIQLIRDWSNCANPHQAQDEQLEQIFRNTVFIQTKEVYCDEP